MARSEYPFPFRIDCHDSWWGLFQDEADVSRWRGATQTSSNINVSYYILALLILSPYSCTVLMCLGLNNLIRQMYAVVMSRYIRYVSAQMKRLKPKQIISPVVGLHWIAGGWSTRLERCYMQSFTTKWARSRIIMTFPSACRETSTITQGYWCHQVPSILSHEVTWKALAWLMY